MLKKTERLTKQEFDTYFKTGRRVHGELLQLIYSPASQFHGAAVAGKKVSKKAVDRNKKRRQLYNALYQLKKDKDLQGVYICIAKPPAAAATYTELKTAIADTISRLWNSRVE